MLPHASYLPIGLLSLLADLSVAEFYQARRSWLNDEREALFASLSSLIESRRFAGRMDSMSEPCLLILAVWNCIVVQFYYPSVSSKGFVLGLWLVLFVILRALKSANSVNAWNRFVLYCCGLFLCISSRSDTFRGTGFFLLSSASSCCSAAFDSSVDFSKVELTFSCTLVSNLEY